MQDWIDAWCAETPAQLDLANVDDERQVYALMERMLAAIEGRTESLDDLERALLEANAPLMLHQAVKLARSRGLVEALANAPDAQPIHVDVVFAMYKEHTRILTPAEHPQGEDFLVRKVGQLHRLLGDLPGVSWQLLAVDDGCPEGSGRMAESIRAERLAEQPVRILFLQDAIEQGLDVAQGMHSTRDSQKGGSVLYGMWEAAQTVRDGHHITLFTDADLSTHLGQVGLLLEPIVCRGKPAAIGSRRERTSVVIKQGSRNSRGKLFIYLWKRMLQNLGHLIDTQCGFKAFRADFIRSVAATTREKRFAIDIELLLQAELLQPQASVNIPVCWIDSEAASTTTDLQPYLPMLRSIAGMYRLYLEPNAMADRFAGFVESLAEPEWQHLLEHIPTAITEREPAAFGAWAGISVQALAAAAGRDVFAPFAEKMRAEALPEPAIRVFERHYSQFLAGETGLIPESAITPVDALPDAEALPEALDALGRDALHQTVLIKLNGGLGTSMGLSQAKSLLKVKGEQTFLDIIAQQAGDAGCPLLLMNSFATRDDSLAALAKYPHLSQGELPLDFVQHKIPKIDRETQLPVVWHEPHLTWCPPGHGDLYTALLTRGVLDALLEAGRRFAFVSNVDNLGAVLDTRILGYFVREQLPFLMEVADRTLADRKGGHLARRHGRLLLRESAQCPPEDLAAFQDVTRHRYFNTNSLWLDLEALSQQLTSRDDVFTLPLIRNAKRVDPTDDASTPVYQLESAMGAAIAVFEGARALRVPRARFAPVKTCNDLLRVRSDATALTEDHRLVPATPRPVVIDLDARYYKHIGALDARFPNGPPSLVDCQSLHVSGDVRFGRGVVCRGAVRIEHRGDTQRVIEDGTVLTGSAS